MKTKLLLITLGLVAMFLVEVGYSLALQRYETGSRQQSFFRDFDSVSCLLQGLGRRARLRQMRPGEGDAEPVSNL